MQTAGAGAEGDVAVPRVVLQRGREVPETRAMDAHMQEMVGMLLPRYPASE
jgi:hypothetical protein